MEKKSFFIIRKLIQHPNETYDQIVYKHCSRQIEEFKKLEET